MQRALAVLNNSGSPIPAGSLVRSTGYTRPAQLQTVDLASAALASTATVLGVMIRTTADGVVGQVIFAGDISADTSTFAAIGSDVFLSDTPGSISTTAGTVSTIVGRVKTLAVAGEITLLCQFTPAAAGGGGGGGESLAATLVIGNVTGGTDIEITGGDSITSTAGSGAGAGSTIPVVAGPGGATGDGGPITITSGAGGSTSGDAGNITITGGAPTDGDGGAITISASDGVGLNQDGGDITVTAGARTGSGAQGRVLLTSGETSYPLTAPGAGPALITTAQTIIEAINENSAGGGGGEDLAATLVIGNITGGTDIEITSGDSVISTAGSGAGSGALLPITAGPGGATGSGGGVTVAGGAGGATSGAGGAITVTGGLAATDGDGGAVNVTGAAGVGTNRDGGDVTVIAGARTGSGDQGRVFLTSGETSYPLTASGVGPALVTTAQTIIEAINENSASVGVFGDGYDSDTDTTFRSTTGTTFFEVHTITTPVVAAGTYRVEWLYIWSHNSNGNDFQAQVEVDNIVNLYEQTDGGGGAFQMHKQEPKDSGGSGDGGTDQRFVTSGWADVVLTNAAHTIDIDISSSNAGTASSVYRTLLAYWRVT